MGLIWLITIPLLRSPDLAELAMDGIRAVSDVLVSPCVIVVNRGLETYMPVLHAKAAHTSSRNSPPSPSDLQP